LTASLVCSTVAGRLREKAISQLKEKQQQRPLTSSEASTLEDLINKTGDFAAFRDMDGED
jgi:hypothetical protein